MVDNTWNEDKQVLEAICQADVRGDDCHVAAHQALHALGIEDEQLISRRLRALAEANYIDAAVTSGGGTVNAHVRRPLERARRATGQWPSADAGDELLRLIAEHVSLAESDEERSRWKRLLDAAKGLGGKAITDVSIALIERQLGAR